MPEQTWGGSWLAWSRWFTRLEKAVAERDEMVAERDREIAELRRLLEEARRSGKRQAAPPRSDAGTNRPTRRDGRAARAVSRTAVTVIASPRPIRSGPWSQRFPDNAYVESLPNPCSTSEYGMHSRWPLLAT
jgi:hypothetical protein